MSSLGKYEECAEMFQTQQKRPAKKKKKKIDVSLLVQILES